MKVGDMVKDNHPNRRGNERFGVIVSESTDRYVSMALNKAFKILWNNGTVGNNVWDYDLRLISESR